MYQLNSFRKYLVFRVAMRVGCHAHTQSLQPLLLPKYVYCSTVASSAAGTCVIVWRIHIGTYTSSYLYWCVIVSITRCQYPIRIAFAMTINKIQGPILDKVGLYLPQPVFSNDQLYSCHVQSWIS